MSESRHNSDGTTGNRRRRREDEGDAKENDNQLLDHVDSYVPKTLGAVASDLALIRRQRFGDVSSMNVCYNNISFSHMSTSEMVDHAIKMQDQYGNDFDRVDTLYVFYNKKDRTENDLEEPRLHSIENPIQPPAKGPRSRENVVIGRRPQVDEAPPDARTPINFYGSINRCRQGDDEEDVEEIDYRLLDRVDSDRTKELGAMASDLALVWNNFDQVDVPHFYHKNDSRKDDMEELRLHAIEFPRQPPAKRPRNRENVVMIGRRPQVDTTPSVATTVTQAEPEIRYGSGTPPAPFPALWRASSSTEPCRVPG
ncbi:hypothetical protein CH63R_03011 [Colletotrichum higginsianum IMI 349063]|uniref:Uncharacterized protein n=1 Tax=Colletotrichum higginsianum (strain IMI 349063) TaxID=759273 RepID=A0A1B7YQG3_COLHI|nr:hypothetical protein CH63R_03011 [Colletotrichum higginsianum IMI 349063]OBR14285.1 hypothetical protein CH63R_03011 [Colletotrichum higginsianum IMI 349063]